MVLSALMPSGHLRAEKIDLELIYHQLDEAIKHTDQYVQEREDRISK